MGLGDQKKKKGMQGPARGEGQVEHLRLAAKTP